MTTTSRPLTAPQPSAAPHLREDLLTPRFYTTEIAKAARTDLEAERPAFEAMLGEMEADYNRDHFDRKAPLDRLRDLAPEQKEAYESYLVRSCVSEFSGFLLFKELSRQPVGTGALHRSERAPKHRAPDTTPSVHTGERHADLVEAI
jgi:magnesium-protoporphyrin IX monomethyl ester (oxidative) cyclase